MCGARLVFACPACAALNPLEYRFCAACGAQLAEEPRLPAAPAPAYPAAEKVREGPPTANNFPAPLAGGERRVATVILADVKNSTSLIEKVGSEAWVAIMDHIFQVLEADIYRFGGIVDQFRGDGLVAFFGTRTADEDDPEHAVLAGLTMQQSLQRYAAELREHEGIPIELRVGINTGEVIVTRVGDRAQHQEYTAMGEAVAVAARMEQGAAPGTVMVSENTYRLVTNRFEWTPLGEIQVKGISLPIPIYRPIKPIQEGDRSEKLDRFWGGIPLVARSQQFQQIKEAVSALLSGRGSIVLVTGEKGMGKSFLVNQVRQHFVRQGLVIDDVYEGDWSPCSPAPVNIAPGEVHLTWLRGRCHSFEQTWPYAMWIDLLQRWLSVCPGERAEEIRARLRSYCQVLFEGQAEFYYPKLVSFLSLPLENPYTERARLVEAEDLQRQIFLTIRGWVEAMVRRSPLVLAFGDVHWADASSLNLLRYCLSVCETGPLAWVVVFRTDRTAPVWEFRHHIETDYPHRLLDMTVPPFSAEETGELIDQLVGCAALSGETRQMVVEKAEGNPYYIRELLHSLIAQGVLAEGPTGTWHETRPVTSLDLPDTLQSLLLARIDRLSPAEKHVLQTAAVIGFQFWRNLLEALVEPNVNLKEALVALHRAQFIQERSLVPELGMEYVFNSSLVRDVAYESLLRPQRVSCHQRIAAYLEQLIGIEGQKQLFSLIAYHYSQAGETRRQLFYTMTAAEKARDVYANAEACEYFNQALALLDLIATSTTDEDQIYAIQTQRFEALNGRSEMNFRLGNSEAGKQDARALLPLARQLAEDSAWLVDALLLQPEVVAVERFEEVETGTVMADEALQLAQRMEDQYREMRALLAVASMRMIRHDHSWLELAERALELARALREPVWEINVLLGMAAAFGMDSLERSKVYLETAITLSDKVGDVDTTLRLLSAIGSQYERIGDYYRLLTDFEEKRLALSREIGSRFAEGNALMYCAQIRGLYLGDYAAGLAQAQEAFKMWEPILGRLFPLLRIAQIQIQLKNTAEAEKILESAYPLSVSAVDRIGRAGLLLVRAILHNAIGSQNCLKKVFEELHEIRWLVDNGQVSRQYWMGACSEITAASLGLAHFAAGEERARYIQDALIYSAEAVAIFENFGFVQIIESTSEEILYRRSLALTAGGSRSESDVLLRRAYHEMTRKQAMIPTDSPYSQTYLAIPVHVEIRAAYARLAPPPPEDENGSA